MNEIFSQPSQFPSCNALFCTCWKFRQNILQKIKGHTCLTTVGNDLVFQSIPAATLEKEDFTQSISDMLINFLQNSRSFCVYTLETGQTDSGFGFNGLLNVELLHFIVFVCPVYCTSCGVHCGSVQSCCVVSILQIVNYGESVICAVMLCN